MGGRARVYNACARGAPGGWASTRSPMGTPHGVASGRRILVLVLPYRRSALAGLLLESSLLREGVHHAPFKLGWSHRGAAHRRPILRPLCTW